MNYCNTRDAIKNNRPPRLSDGDIQTMTSIYKAAPSSGAPQNTGTSATPLVNQPAPFNITYPPCVKPGSDPDGDGWGWEDGKSCTIRK